ncbi:hypothetical protein CsatB_018718 [Cannabis sativa]
MAAELVGGALLSAFLAPLVEKLASEVKDFFKGKDAILKLVMELKTLLSSADLLLIDAEEKLIKDQAVRKWLDNLKDAIYDADDLVYKIDTAAWRNQQEGVGQHEDHSGCSCTSKALMRLISSTPLTSFDKNIKPEIEETLEKLKLLLDNKDLGLERVKNHKLPKRVCAPLVEESDVYGRDGDKEAIINLLLLDDKFSVIPIVGMGGIGKTTLAQLVYNDARVTKMFDTRVWVTVGDDDKVNSSKVMKTIILKVKSAKCKFEEEFEVLNEVKEVLAGKKFLIVLDDVWDEDSNRWEAIKSTFQSGLPGSKIIVTTRYTRVASIMGTKSSSTYFLSTISFDKGWELFVRFAAIDVNSHEYSDLQVIGQKIVEKCNGLPLAIKSLGGLLRGKQNKEDWDDILNNDIWELYERERVGILPALWLSYFYLPSHLKSCFSYCAIFPKDYKYTEEELVLLWMGEGLLLSKKGTRIEDIGSKYLKDLISMSFFQPSNDNAKKPTFLMHDLIHDLAMFVSGDFCLTMNKIGNCSRKVRHFSYMLQCAKADDPKEFKDLFKAKCLRTLLWEQGSSSGQLRLLKIEDLDKSFPVLRVLSIEDNEITKLPDSIGNLKYLRYLKLDCGNIEEIPNTICKLYNLETLLLEGCANLTIIPTDIGNLIKLQHLSVPRSLDEMPLQLGKLPNLQTLNRFVVGRNRDCSGIELLKEFQDLHGSLSIEGLQNVNVSRLEEVLDAAAPLLKSKKSLSHLSLVWSAGHYPKLDELHKERELLNALQPHPNLKELFIWHYKGNSFPNWMGDHRCLSNLVSLNLLFCDNCRFLPSLGQLPSLKYLWICGLKGVVRIDSKFYCSSSSVAIQTKPLFFTSLETLNFMLFSMLEEWSFMEGGGFPRLKNLCLYDCSRLKVTLLRDYFPSLTVLQIDNCGETIPLLLPRAQLNQAPLITLKKIEFRNCPNLTHLDEEAFQHLTSLEELRIEDCPNLECLPKELPTSLSNLQIIDCPLLTPRVDRETGEDWPIIAHIPNITVKD